MGVGVGVNNNANDSLIRVLGRVYISETDANEFQNKMASNIVQKAGNETLEMLILQYLLRSHPVTSSPPSRSPGHKDQHQYWRLISCRSPTFSQAFDKGPYTLQHTSDHTPPNPISPVVTYWLHTDDIPTQLRCAMPYATMHPDLRMLYPYLIIALHADFSLAARHPDLTAGAARALDNRAALRAHDIESQGKSLSDLRFFAVLLTPDEFAIWSFHLADGHRVRSKSKCSVRSVSISSRAPRPTLATSVVTTTTTDLLCAPPLHPGTGNGQDQEKRRPRDNRRDPSSLSRTGSHHQPQRGRNNGDHPDGGGTNGGPEVYLVATRLAQGNHLVDVHLATLVTWLNAIHYWAATEHGPAVSTIGTIGR